MKDRDREGNLAATDVRAFVDTYARALTGGDGDTIAAHYDVPALLHMSPGAPGIVVTDRAELGARFSAAAAIYRSYGFGDPVGHLTRTETLTDELHIIWGHVGLSRYGRGQHLRSGLRVRAAPRR